MYSIPMKLMDKNGDGAVDVELVNDTFYSAHSRAFCYRVIGGMTLRETSQGITVLAAVQTL